MQSSNAAGNIKSKLTDRFQHLSTFKIMCYQWIQPLHIRGPLSKALISSEHFGAKDYFPAPIVMRNRKLKPFAVLIDRDPSRKQTTLSEIGIKKTLQASFAAIEAQRSRLQNSSAMQSNNVKYTPRTRSPRFNCFLDIMLLREVVSQNPFIGTQERPWEAIAAAMKTYMPSVLGKTCKERVFRLLKMHKENGMLINLQRGEKEQYGERDELILVVREMEAKMGLKEEESCTKSRKQEDDAESAIMEQIRGTMINTNLHPQVTIVTDHSPVASTSDLEIENERDFKRRRVTVSNGFSTSHQEEQEHAAEMRLREDELKFLKDQLEVTKRRLDLKDRKLELAELRWNTEMEERREGKRMMMELIQMAMKK